MKYWCNDKCLLLKVLGHRFEFEDQSYQKFGGKVTYHDIS